MLILYILLYNPGNDSYCHIPFFIYMRYDKRDVILLSNGTAVIAGMGNGVDHESVPWRRRASRKKGHEQGWMFPLQRFQHVPLFLQLQRLLPARHGLRVPLGYRLHLSPDRIFTVSSAWLLYGLLQCCASLHPVLLQFIRKVSDSEQQNRADLFST